MSVLIFTEQFDVHGHALVWALKQLGIHCDIWSLANFPDRQLSSIRLSNATPVSISMPGLSSEDYTSIWMRRSGWPEAISDQLAQSDVEMALIESQNYIDGLRTLISPGSVWINPLQTQTHATSKPYQLKAAKNAGFIIPETLFSNDPDEIRRFFWENKGKIIYKPFIGASWENQATHRGTGLFTSHFSEKLLRQPDVAFTSCPAIYQRRIEKKSELRVTFFGATYQAARIYSQQVEGAKLDWRSDLKNESQMEETVLEASLEERCREFASELGLLHGSLDLIEQPDGSIIFLEVNEMGQFLWMEQRVPKLPLLAIFAAFSLEPSPNFVFDSNRWPVISMHDYLASKAYADLRKDSANRANSKGKKAFCYSE